VYAIIRAGGKQYKVAEGDVLEVEKLTGETVQYEPLLVVDDAGTTRLGRDALAGARVHADVVGDAKGPKVHVVKFRNKTGYRRRTGHRQKYSTIQISRIELGAGS